MTTSLVTIYTTAVVSLKGTDIVAVVLEALRRSVVTVVGEIGETKEVSGGGELTTSLETVELVLSVSPSGPAPVYTAAEALRLVEISGRDI